MSKPLKPNVMANSISSLCRPDIPSTVALRFLEHMYRKLLYKTVNSNSPINGGEKYRIPTHRFLGLIECLLFQKSVKFAPLSPIPSNEFKTSPVFSVFSKNIRCCPWKAIISGLELKSVCFVLFQNLLFRHLCSGLIGTLGSSPRYSTSAISSIRFQRLRMAFNIASG